MAATGWQTCRSDDKTDRKTPAGSAIPTGTTITFMHIGRKPEDNTVGGLFNPFHPTVVEFNCTIRHNGSISARRVSFSLHGHLITALRGHASNRPTIFLPPEAVFGVRRFIAAFSAGRRRMTSRGLSTESGDESPHSESRASTATLANLAKPCGLQPLALLPSPFCRPLPVVPLVPLVPDILSMRAVPRADALSSRPRFPAPIRS